MGEHPFKVKENRIEAAKFLNLFMKTNDSFKIVAVGGTALGFRRNSDFIEWDFDMDLFASINHYDEIFNFLLELNYTF